MTTLDTQYAPRFIQNLSHGSVGHLCYSMVVVPAFALHKWIEKRHGISRARCHLCERGCDRSGLRSVLIEPAEQCRILSSFDVWPVVLFCFCSVRTQDMPHRSTEWCGLVLVPFFRKRRCQFGFCVCHRLTVKA